MREQQNNINPVDDETRQNVPDSQNAAPWEENCCTNDLTDQPQSAPKTDAEETNAPENKQKQNKNGKFGTAVNRSLTVIIIILAVLLVTKVFFVSSVTVSGSSMEPTYLSEGETVTVNKLATPERGDIVVAFKYDIDSKLKAYFAPKSQTLPGKKYFKIIKRAVAIGGDKIWTETLPDGTYVFALEIDDTVYYEFYYWDTEQTKPFPNRDKGHYVLATSLEQATQLYGKYVVQITMEPRADDWLSAYDSQENCYVVPKKHFLAFGDNRSVSEDSRSNSLKAVPYSRVMGVVV